MANESGEAVMIILSRSGMLPQEKTSLSIVAILHLWRVWHGLLIVKALLQGALMLQYRYGSLTPVILSTPVDWARPENCLATAGAPRTSLDAPEVTAARGSEEGVDHFSASGEIGVGNHGRSLHPAAGAARELPCRGLRAPHDGSDLVEGHGEEVVQHEREALSGRKRVEYHEQRETDRVGQERFLLR